MPPAIGEQFVQGQERPGNVQADRRTHQMRKHGHGDKRAVQYANQQKEGQMQGAGSNRAAVHHETKALARGAGRQARQGAEFS